MNTCNNKKIYTKLSSLSLKQFSPALLLLLCFSIELINLDLLQFSLSSLLLNLSWSCCRRLCLVLCWYEWNCIPLIGFFTKYEHWVCEPIYHWLLLWSPPQQHLFSIHWTELHLPHLSCSGGWTVNFTCYCHLVVRVVHASIKTGRCIFLFYWLYFYFFLDDKCSHDPQSKIIISVNHEFAFLTCSLYVWPQANLTAFFPHSSVITALQCFGVLMTNICVEISWKDLITETCYCYCV